jgi:Lon protease-like protein
MNRIPLFPLGLVLLPGMALPLHIFEERYKQMISECLAARTSFGIIWFDGQSIHSVGCTARVIKVLHRYEDGRMDILTKGERLRKGVEALARILERVQVTQQIRKIIGGNGHPPPEALHKLSGADAS